MLTIRLDQFSSLEEFARGYRQHVTRTTVYLPTRLKRPEASLLTLVAAPNGEDDRARSVVRSTPAALVH